MGLKWGTCFVRAGSFTEPFYCLAVQVLRWNLNSSFLYWCTSALQLSQGCFCFLPHWLCLGNSDTTPVTQNAGGAAAWASLSAVWPPQTYQTCQLITAFSPDLWHMQTGPPGWSILLNKCLWQLKINVSLTSMTFLLHIKKNSYTLEVRNHLLASVWNILKKRRPSIGKGLN